MKATDQLFILREPAGFRWEVRARNGAVVDQSEQHYKRYRRLRDNLKRNVHRSPKTWPRLAKIAHGRWVYPRNGTRTFRFTFTY